MAINASSGNYKLYVELFLDRAEEAIRGYQDMAQLELILDTIVVDQGPMIHPEYITLIEKSIHNADY